MLDYDADTRIRPLEALQHPFFHREGNSQLPESLLPLDVPQARGVGQCQGDPHLPIIQTASMTSAESMTVSQEMTLVSMETDTQQIHTAHSNSVPICPPPPPPHSQPLFSSISSQSHSMTSPPVMGYGGEIPTATVGQSSLPSTTGSPFSHIPRHPSSPPYGVVEGNKPFPFPPPHQNGYPQTFYGTHALFHDVTEPQQFSFKLNSTSSSSPHSSLPNPYQSHPHQHHLQVRKDGSRSVTSSNGGRTGRGYSHRHRTGNQRTESQEDSPMLGIVQQ